MVNPATVAPATAGVLWTQTVTPVGGVGPYRYSVSSGSLPQGLILNNNGTITGIPTTAGATTFAVTITDSATPTDSGTRTYTTRFQLRVDGNPPKGQVGGWFSTQFSAYNGTAPYHLAASGSVPPGLTMSSSGTLSGKPTTAGTYTFTVSSTDAASPANSGGASFTIVVS